MEKKNFIKSEVVELDGRKFTTSLIPCDPSHEIWTKLSDVFGSTFSAVSFMKTPSDIAWRILSYTAAYSDDDTWEVLDSKDARDKYLSSEGQLLQLLFVMVKRNYGFFFDGSLFLWLELLADKRLPS